jgi:hypothetical protein
MEKTVGGDAVKGKGESGEHNASEPAPGFFARLLGKTRSAGAEDGDLARQKRKPLSWSKENAPTSIDVLFQDVEAAALDSINWYYKKKARPSLISRYGRAGAIVLLALGGICPLLAGAKLPFAWMKLVDFGDIGYLSFGIAAALLLVDRYGGFSTAWMRYVSTATRLQRILKSFQIDWQISRAQLDLNPDEAKLSERIILLLEKLRDFVSKVMSEVEAETEAWMTEFRDSLAQLQRSIREQQSADAKSAEAPAARGSATITVSNYAEAKEAVFVLLDEFPMAKMIAPTVDLAVVAAGSHVVVARTTRDGALVQASRTIDVVSGQKTAVTLTLPFQPPRDDDAGAGGAGAAAGVTAGAAAGQTVAPSMAGAQDETAIPAPQLTDPPTT